MEKEIREFKAHFELDGIRAGNRTIVATASTENPVSRIEGDEVLVHKAGAIDFSRFPLAVVARHKSDEMDAFARAKNPRIVNRKLKVDLVFGKSAKAQEVWQDIQDEIATHVSIGYLVLKKTRPDSTGTYYVTRWQPIELSIVPVPADIDAVIGRSATFNQDIQLNKLKNHFMGEEKKMEKSFAEIRENFDKQNFRTFTEQLAAIQKTDLGVVDNKLRSQGLMN